MYSDLALLTKMAVSVSRVFANVVVEHRTLTAGISAPTVTTLVLGLITLICGGFYENRTKRDTLFPPSVFTNSTAGGLLLLASRRVN